MFDEPLLTPRTWKWSVPAGIAILLGWGATQLTKEWAVLLWALCGLCLAVAFTNYWKLISAHREDLYEKHQHALSLTPLVLLSENMKQMHPEAVRVLNRFGVRTSWQVRVNSNAGSRDWVLADTNVHFGFIEFVLTKSGRALLPKRHFSEGSHKWDPDGLVEDRQQYAEFESWLFARLMVTRSHGEFQPAEFIPPWTPRGIMDVMGMAGEQDLYYPEEAPRKNLNELKPVSSQPPTVNGNGHKPEPPVDLDELTDADMEAIRLEMERNAKQYRQ